MPDADTVQNRQKVAAYSLIVLPIILIVLYIIPVPITGRVVDAASEQPLAGVPVVLDNGIEVRTDSAGEFSLRSTRFNAIAATVEHEGYQPGQGKSRYPVVPMAPARLAVDLQPTVLRGQVVDASSGGPISDANLRVGGVAAVTDASGAFELSYLPREALTLEADAEGFIALEQSLGADWPWNGSEEIEVQLLPNGLHGTVTDASTGEPLANVSARYGEKSAQSEDNGFYYLSHVAAGDDLRLSLPGYLPAVVPVESAVVIKGDEALDVVLQPTVLAGQVLDGRTGEPLAGVELTAGGQTATTDQEGRFRFERLHGADIVLAATLTGYEADQWPVDEQSSLLDAEALDLELLPKHLAGRVLNKVTDSPLAGATAIAGANAATTDEDGRFRLWGAEPPLTVFVSADGFFDGEGQYQDNTELTLSLKPRHAVITVEERGGGQRLAEVSLSGQRSESTTDAQGVALLPLVEPGETFTATLDGYAPAAVVYDGGNQVKVELYRDTVAGQVVDQSTGAPAPGALVYVYDAEACQGDACRGTLPAAVVDARDDGTFVAQGLPPNPQLMVKAPGYGLLFPEVLQEGDCGAPLCASAELEPFEARGFYIPFHYLYDRGLMQQRMDLVAESPVLNAVVVDMKSDFGELAWESRYPVAQELGVHQPDVMQADEVVQMCRERGIYCIARFVVFKDDPLAKGRPEWAVRKKSEPNIIWLDGEELAWVDPYRPEVREYEIELAKELAEVGFDELQFDYFRFTGQDHTKFIYSVDSDVDNRREAISSFAEELMDELKPYGVFTAIDVFGSIILVGQEPLIGQNLAEMAVHLDYLNPMIYPQVWWPGSFPPYDEPVFYPYEVIYDSVATVREIVPMPTRIRPWLQGYPNNYRPHGYNYKVPEMMIQRQASEDAGGEGWLFWSGGGNFQDAIFGPMPTLADLRAQVAQNQAGYR